MSGLVEGVNWEIMMQEVVHVYLIHSVIGRNLVPLQSLVKWSLQRFRRPNPSPAASILEVLDADSSTSHTISSSLRQET